MNSNLLWLILTTIIVFFITFHTTPDATTSIPLSRPQTIGVILVAYHETSCIGAIETALSLAKNPHRLSFFIVNAGATNDKKSCLNGYNDFQSGTGSTIVTNFIKSISEIHSEFYGPNAAKSELIQKEIAAKNKTFDYILEIHAHSLFTYSWDVETISKWKLARNAKAILTTNPSRTTEISARMFDHHAGKTMNIICAARFKNHVEIVYDDPWEIRPTLKDTNGEYVPIQVPFWSSYFSFGPFEYLSDVAYDPQLKAAIDEDGFDFWYSARLRTHGFKMYAPVKDLVFHNYDAHKFEFKYKIHRDKNYMRQDYMRMHAMVFDTIHVKKHEEFGFGKEMDLAKYLDIVGVDLKNHTAQSMCEKIRQNKWHS